MDAAHRASYRKCPKACYSVPLHVSYAVADFNLAPRLLMESTPVPQHSRSVRCQCSDMEGYDVRVSAYLPPAIR